MPQMVHVADACSSWQGGWMALIDPEHPSDRQTAAAAMA